MFTNCEMDVDDNSQTWKLIEWDSFKSWTFTSKYKCAVCKHMIDKDDTYEKQTEGGIGFYAPHSRVLKGFVCTPCIPYVPKPSKCRACEQKFASKGALFKHLKAYPNHNVCTMR